MRDLRDYSLLNHNTFGIEAKCSRCLEYASVEEAQQVAAILRQEKALHLYHLIREYNILSWWD